MKFSYIALLTIVLLIGCGTKKADPIISVADTDPLMAAAFKEAKDKIDVFDKSIGQVQYCAIKVGLQFPGDIEYCWIGKIRKNGEKYVGNLDNEPVHDVGYKLGDEVVIDKKQIADWIVKEKGKPVQGNFTLKALFPKMDKQEVAEAKKAMGWD